MEAFSRRRPSFGTITEEALTLPAATHSNAPAAAWGVAAAELWEPFGGKVLKTSLTNEQEARLQKAVEKLQSASAVPA